MMSLNPIPGIIRYVELQDRWKFENSYFRNWFGINLSFEDWLKLKKIDLDSYCSRPVDMLKYYNKVSNNARGKYSNNKIR